MDFCLEKAVGVGDSTWPLALRMLFLRQWVHHSGLGTQQGLTLSLCRWLQDRAGTCRNMQEQISRFKRSPVHLLTTQMAGKKKSLGLWLHRLSQHPNKLKSWRIPEPFEGKFSNWERGCFPCSSCLWCPRALWGLQHAVAGLKEVWGQDGSLMKLVDLFHLDESASFTFWMS